jgi:hypothetical protein
MPEEKQDRQTEQTPKGLTVPVPKRREFFDNLKKVAEPDAERASASEKPKR